MKMINITNLIKYFVVLLLSMISSSLTAEEATIKGSAYYLEQIVLPPNAIFEAALEDVSLMDVRAPVLGNVVIESITSIPINFSIQYNSYDIKQRHRYNVRGRITVDGRLMFITDTAHPVLTDKEQGEFKLKMRMLQSFPGK